MLLHQSNHHHHHHQLCRHHFVCPFAKVNSCAFVHVIYVVNRGAVFGTRAREVLSVRAWMCGSVAAAGLSVSGCVVRAFFNVTVLVHGGGDDPW